MIKIISKIMFWFGLVLVVIGGLFFDIISGDVTLYTIKLLLECNTLLIGGICMMIYSYNLEILRKVDENGKTD